jgi:hypothetical protein
VFGSYRNGHFSGGDIKEVDAIQGFDGDEGREERFLRNAGDVDVHGVGFVDQVRDMDIMEKLDFPFFPRRSLGFFLLLKMQTRRLTLVMLM